jgi:flagellar motility protein MotE (MotC chaperone)
MSGLCLVRGSQHLVSQQRGRRFPVSAFVAVLMLMSAIQLAGCADWQQLERAQARTQDIARQLQEQRESIESRVSTARQAAATSEDPLLRAQAAELERLLERIRVQEQAARAAATELDTIVARANGTSGDDVGSAIGSVSPFIPEPFRVPLALGAAVVLSLARAAQLKRATLSIAQSFEKAMESDEELRQRVESHAPTLRTIQTATARRLVDVATGKTKPMISIPV